MKYLSNVWQWSKNNVIGIATIIVVIVGMLSLNNTITEQAQNKKELLTCKTLCFPQQSEYITYGQTSACWCYVDQNTMKKANQ